MNGVVVWILAAVGIAIVMTRRRSVAVGLVTAQALVITLVALLGASTVNELAAGIALLVRTLALAGLFLLLVARTREPIPVRANVPPLVRGGFALSLALVLTVLVPNIGLEPEVSEQGVLALVAFGVVTAATRRATVFQVLGIVLVENGLALAALGIPGGSSFAIEIGVAFDLMLVVIVAAIFHERIFAEFGTGDSAELRSLRD